METDPTRMCELLVGLPDVNVRGVRDEHRSATGFNSTRDRRTSSSTPR